MNLSSICRRGMVRKRFANIHWLVNAVPILKRHTCFFHQTKKQNDYDHFNLNRIFFVWWKKQVCRLKRSLYGLRDESKIFNEELVQHLQVSGYSQSVYEPCLFYKWNQVHHHHIQRG